MDRLGWGGVAWRGGVLCACGGKRRVPADIINEYFLK